MQYVIETEALTRQFGGKLALNKLDLKIPPGRIHAIVGANGAGKSTLFRILLGFLSPNSGSARILGRDCSRLSPADRARIGFVNEEHSLPLWMPVARLIQMQRRQYSQQQRWNEALLEEVIGHFHILPTQKVAELSRGERAGLNLALALAQSPELLILDEPTLGLDVVAKRAFLEALLFANLHQDCTIIYCSHQMEEIERIADNLIILEQGELRHMSAPDEFCQRVSLWQVEFPFRTPDLRQLPGYLQSQQLDALSHVLALDQDESFGETLKAMGARRALSMPVSLDRAVNAYLSKNHHSPNKGKEICHV